MADVQLFLGIVATEGVFCIPCPSLHVNILLCEWVFTSVVLESFAWPPGQMFIQCFFPSFS